jgi:phosphatidylserine/phosphatidylglycerophosphate/cardiolipin synthase-like enzyme
MMHAKTTVIDGHLTRVGSTDFNPLGMGSTTSSTP